MKLVSAAGVVESSGLGRTGFKIRASRKAFEILSSGLYSDKPRAVVRELCCNAADAMVFAGRGHEPFKVRLPNALAPEFSVRDFGPGLSEEEVNGLYTTYFQSTKDDSDDYTGCLGLGSKSPFCLADQFQVVSHQGGCSTTYVCFLDEERCPGVSRLGEAFNGEPDGLEVTLAVPRSLHQDFQKAASSVLAWFSPRPGVAGCHGFAFDKKDYLFEGPDWALPRAYGDGKGLAVMGNVAYPIKPYSVPLAGDFTATHRNLIEYGLVLRLPLGAVDFTAGREELGYDARTCDALRAAAVKALGEIKVRVVKDFEACPTVWQARRKAHEYLHSFVNGNLRDTVPQAWKGLPCGPTLRKPAGADKALWHYELKHSRKTGEESLHADELDSVGVGDKDYLLNDTPHDVRVRVKQWMRAQGKKKCYVVSQDVGRAYLDDTGLSEVLVRTSTLPAPVIARAAKAPAKDPGPKGRLLRLARAYGTDAKSYWADEDSWPAPGTGVYAVVNRYRLDGLGEYVSHPRDLTALLNDLAKAGEPLALHGVRPSDHEWLRAKKGWTPFKDALAARAERLTPKALLASDFSNLPGARYVRALAGDAAKALDPRSEFLAFLNRVAAAWSALETINPRVMKDRLSRYGVEVEWEASALAAEKKALFARYPLLLHANEGRFDDPEYRADLLEYIRQKESPAGGP